MRCAVRGRNPTGRDGASDELKPGPTSKSIKLWHPPYGSGSPFSDNHFMKTLAFILLILFLHLPVVSQTLEERLAEIDAYAKTVITTHGGPGMAIAIVKDDKVVLAKGYGVRQLSKADQVDENTTFAIASNSKAFTTAALAILVDEKKLAWDDKVSKYLPDFQMYDPWVTSELTVRDLVTHRVGLDTFSGDLLWYDANFTSDEILTRVRYLKPVSSFRTRYGYQNLMFIAAGKVVEKVSGKSWCGYVTERILTPLGMYGTTCGFGKLGPNTASPHNESGGTLRVLPQGNVDGGYGAVALNSSVADLSKWIRTQLGKGKFEGKQIFSEQQAWQMHQPYLTQPISEAASRNNPTRHFSGVAMGWFVYDYHGRKIINHSGGLDGMLSYTVLIPEENVGFVVLTNSEGPGFAIMMNKIRDVFVNAPKRDYNNEAIETVKRNKAAADEERRKQDAARVQNTKPSLAIANYAGTYSDKLYGDITIADEGGKLVMRFSRSPNFVADLHHWHYDTFEIRWRQSVSYNFPRGFVTFTIDRAGKTDELKIDQPNNDFWFYELTPRRVN
jgi:CubicO group peptidase (beta-lactamase class C family)